MTNDDQRIFANVSGLCPGVPLSLDEYAVLAGRTAGDVDAPIRRLICAGLGVAGEAGEAADLVKKIAFHGHPFDAAAEAKLVKEAGDVLWYLALLVRAIRELGGTATLDHVAKTNIVKLAKRYPDGFTVERSRNRPEDAT